jgi:hypothetical protein
VRFEHKNVFFYIEKRSSLLQGWCCSCKFECRRIGSWLDSNLHLLFLIRIRFQRATPPRLDMFSFRSKRRHVCFKLHLHRHVNRVLQTLHILLVRYGIVCTDVKDSTYVQAAPAFPKLCNGMHTFFYIIYLLQHIYQYCHNRTTQLRQMPHFHVKAPDFGIFSYQSTQFWYILEGLGIADCDNVPFCGTTSQNRPSTCRMQRCRTKSVEFNIDYWP